MSENSEKKPPRQQIPLKADDEVQAGHYSNLARISHDAESFVVDFVFAHSSPPFGKLLSRIILTPGHAKRLAAALLENVKTYERNWGPIREAPPPEDDLGSVQ